MPTPEHSWWTNPPSVLRSVVTVASVTLAVVLGILFEQRWHSTPYVSLFLCAVIFSAWFGGFVQGFLAVALSAFAFDCFFLTSRPSLELTPNEVPRLLLFVVSASAVALLGAIQRNSADALRQARDALAAKVQELYKTNENLQRENLERKRAESLLEGQRRVMEMVATDAPLSESLRALVLLIEAHAPGMLGSVLLLDPKGVHLRHGAAPNLPKEYVAAIDGVAIGPEVGSCGTAAFCKEPVLAEDIATDPRWKEYKALALPHGLRACWSTPIFDAHRRVLGTFAMYYRQTGLPKPEHLQLIAIATHTASLAIGRHLAERALLESEAKLKAAQRLANIGYWERDLITGRITWSEQTCRIWGQQPAGCILNQAEMEKMIHPDDRPIQRQALADAIAISRPYDVEYRIIRPDGEIRFLHIRDDIEKDPDGRPVRIFGTVQDITERKRMEELLKESETKYRTFFQSSNDIILFADKEGNILDINPRAEQLTGYPQSDLRKMNIFQHLIVPEDQPHIREVIKDIFEGRSRKYQERWRTKVGKIIYLEGLSIPRKSPNGEALSTSCTLRDITDRKLAEENEQKLRQTEAELARVSKLTTMGELTASIAHEVNQPLAAVVTNAEAAMRWLVAAHPNLDEAREAIERIARDGKRASEVIKRIRTFMKKGEPVRTRLNLNKLVQETVALAQPEFTRKKVSVRTDLSPDLPRVPADRVQVQQVLLNLVVNALDSMGSVAGRQRVLHITTDLPGPDAVHVAIRDNGAGIGPQEAPHLYDTFFTTKPDGLGMGLAICRSILEAHGGRLWETPNDGPGVTFQFTLPLQDEGAS